MESEYKIDVPAEICCNRCKYSKHERRIPAGWELYCSRVGSPFQRDNVSPFDCFCERFRHFYNDMTFKDIIAKHAVRAADDLL